MELELRAFGPLEVTRAGTQVRIGSRLRRVLLAVLLAHRGQVVSVANLAASMWPDQPSTAVARSLHIHVHRLRRALGGIGVLSYRPPGYTLTVPPEQIDIYRFEELVRRGRAALAAGDQPGAVALLRQAVAWCRGPAFQGLDDIPEVASAADRIEQLRLDAIEGRITAELALGGHAELVAELAALVAEHPLRERFRAQLMTALYHAGRKADALAVFRDGRRLLVTELGIEPNLECRELERAILRDDPVRQDQQPADPVPRQLPADLATFTGRVAELARLDRWLADPLGTVRLAVVEGLPGIGKTTLAVHWAHRVRDRFPDGQLHVDLRGFHPSGKAMEPGEAIRGFLAALGVPPARLPAGLDAQAGLYRSLLAGRRVLVVLDNARAAGQVRPLLPGGPGCLVLVTSRSQLPGLVATDAARTLRLDVPSPGEARELLDRRLGRDRTAAEPEAVDRILAGCGRLPLALAIVAARAAAAPQLRLDSLRGELGQAAAGLSAAPNPDPVTDIRAVFSWSYQALGRPAARLFRLLGRHAGPDLATAAAASLAGVPVPRAEALLAELTRCYLLAEPTPGRFSLHDLVRGYAAELAQRHDPAPERRSALHRLLDHYLHTARAAALLLDPTREPVPAAPPGAGVSLVALANHQQALDWFHAEHPALVAAVGQAARAGSDAHTWRLARSLTTFQDRRGYWHDLATNHETALQAARRLADQPTQAALHRLLARAYARLGDPSGAETHLHRALELFGRLGDQPGRAHAHLDLGKVFEIQGRLPAALGQARRALGLYRATGHRLGQAIALNSIGFRRCLLGDHRRGLADCQAALTLSRAVGNRSTEALSWDSLGYAQHRLGDHALAARCYQYALALFRELGDRYCEAQILVHTGEVRIDDGDPAGGRDAFRQAWSILRDIGHPDADQVQARLTRPQVP